MGEVPNTDNNWPERRRVAYWKKCKWCLFDSKCETKDLAWSIPDVNQGRDVPIPKAEIIRMYEDTPGVTDAIVDTEECADYTLDDYWLKDSSED